MRKSPQERKSAFKLDHDHWEDIRLKADDDGIIISHKVGDSYRGLELVGEDGVRQMRDYLDAWLEANESEGGEE